MMRKWMLLMSVALAALPGFASDLQESPKGDMVVVEDTSNDGHRIWLQLSKDPKKKELLYTYGRQAHVVFSDDESLLVINDKAASNEDSVLLFRRLKGLRYEQVKDLSDVWSFLNKQIGKDVDWDHCYAHGHVEGSWVMLTLDGYGNKVNNVDNWQCYYDLKKKRYGVTKDMVEHNRGLVTTDGVKNQ